MWGSPATLTVRMSKWHIDFENRAVFLSIFPIGNLKMQSGEANFFLMDVRKKKQKILRLMGLGAEVRCQSPLCPFEDILLKAEI